MEDKLIRRGKRRNLFIMGLLSLVFWRLEYKNLLRYTLSHQLRALVPFWVSTVGVQGVVGVVGEGGVVSSGWVWKITAFNSLPDRLSNINYIKYSE